MAACGLIKSVNKGQTMGANGSLNDLIPNSNPRWMKEVNYEYEAKEELNILGHGYLCYF